MEPGTVALGKVGAKLFEIAEREGYLDRFIDWLNKRHRILVVGSTGVGKTNFIDSLTELMPAAIDAWSRTEFATRYRIKIQKQPFEVIDTPGQLGHASRRLEEIRKAMRGGLTGVLNVVAYGYHEYKDAGSEALSVDTREAFLERHRQVEVDALNEWSELLADQATTEWIITVVSKADLWWNDRAAVLAYYQEGPYAQALGAPGRSMHSALEYSSVFHKFYGSGELAGTFDDGDRERAKEHLIKEMVSASSRKFR